MDTTCLPARLLLTFICSSLNPSFIQVIVKRASDLVTAVFELIDNKF